MASQRDYRSQEHTRTLPERVGQLYYSHGLFCSSHPVPVIVFAISVVLLCCYPLLNLPMPGNVPQQLFGNLSIQGKNGTDNALPQWLVGPPMVYIQQVIVKTAVCPWTKDMLLTDAFRAPLSEVFKLLEVIHNYQHENSSKTLSHLCLHVEAVKTKSDKKLQLPEYNCLVLSPANLWQQNPELYHEDPNLLSTIYNYQNLQKGKISLAEMLFGMNMKDTGIKRYPLRTRQRVLQFAVTIVFKEYDPIYMNGLQKRLTSLFPLHQPSNMMSYLSIDSNETTSTIASSHTQEVLHVYYPGEFNVRELIPLTITYFILFLYVYFSVRKIELVKSKVGMAFSALMTALASLFMSVGLCFFFGLTLSLNSKDIFPYLVLIIALENVLVLTKSVVSTPTHLDVKIRVAQGLSREGWSITKNLLTEVTILTIGFFTFVPEIQKFCIFAVVGLISDFFLQMFFFSTVLAIDIRRMELSTESHHHKIQYSLSNNSSLHQPVVRQSRSSASPTHYKTLPRSRSHPRLNGLNIGSLVSSNYPTNVVAPHHNAPQMLVKLPKRLRLVHFWARTRFFQRTFMIFMVVWISFIVYNAGFVEQLLQVNPDSVVSEKIPSEMGSRGPIAFEQNKNHLFENLNKALNKSESMGSVVLDQKYLKSFNSVVDAGLEEMNPESVMNEKNGRNESDYLPSEELARLQHSGFDPWRRLSHHHWPAILSMYNISVAGRYISILPSIRLSLSVTPDVARSLRNLEEHTGQHFQWQALAVALDPLDFSDGENIKIPPEKTFLGADVPFVPTSPMEIFLTSVLCVISIAVVAYMLVVLYRCVCSRNYAEWRASWSGDSEEARDAITQVVMEAVPLILEGHQQEVECLSTDGAVIVSSCLGGHLCVWDSVSGDPLVTVDRKSYFISLQKSSTGSDIKLEEQSFSDYESGSPPSRGETSDEISQRNNQFFWDLPDLQSSIVTNFSSRPSSWENRSVPNVKQRKGGFYYGSKYEELYREHQYSRSCTSSDFQRSDLNWLSEEKRRQNHCKRHSDCDSMPFCSESLSSVPTLERGRRDICDSLNENSNVCSFQTSHYSSCEEGADIESANCVSEQNITFVESCVCSSRSCGGSCSCVVREKDLFHERSGIDSRIQEMRGNEHFSETLETMSPSFGSVRNKSSLRDPFSARKTSRLLPTMSFAITNPNSPTATDCSKVYSNNTQVPPIWCLDCHENLIVVGCASGRLEFWEGSTGKFKCLFEDGSGIGITHVKVIGNRVVAAKLSGAVDFLELKSFSQGQPTDWGFTYRRTHVRTNSAGALSDWETWASQHGEDEDIRCVRLITLKAHQQPITVLDSEGGRVLTGSQDHTLKVFRLEDQLPLYTLHGHTGPISCLFIDRISPMMSGSGSQDGLLCVWDLLTGACMYSIQAHDGSVVALTYSASYVISLGTDERLCVWERFQGHLLNTIQVAHTYCSSMVMLTHNLLITSKQGSLVVWDVRTGVPVRVVTLGHSDKCVFVKQILLLRDSVVCDYSKQLRIVRFPLVTDKCE